MNAPQPPDRPALTEWACVHLGRDLADTAPATGRLLDWLRGHGANDPVWLGEVELAVTEALTNAIRHGTASASDEAGGVRLAWCLVEGRLEIEVSEPGHFSPTESWAELPADPLSEGGRGGFLITRLMDAVDHRNAGGRHALRLRRGMPARSAPAGCIQDSVTAVAPVSPALASTAAQAEVEAALDAMTEELGNAYETIAALFSLAEELATTPGLRDLATKGLVRLRPLLGADAAWVRLADEDGALTLLAHDGAAPARADLAPDAATAEAEAARAGLERTLGRRADLAPDDPLHATAGSAFVCPFDFEGRLRGVLTVARDADGAGFFTAGQTALARTVADFLGIACANADLQRQRQARQRAQQELEIAARIQRTLLPSAIAPHPGWLIAGVCTQAAEVGGDFYDVIDLADGARLIVIADVMGKGVPAALVAATLRTALRTLAGVAAGPGELLTRANRQLCPDLDRLGMFITVQLLRLDATGVGAAYASAGHCPMLVLDGHGAATWWDEAGGLPVGVEATEDYPEARGRIAPGGRLWLMTDGALEHEDARGAELGQEGFARLAAEAAGGPEALRAALHARAAGHAVRDDCTLVCVRPVGEDVRV